MQPAALADKRLTASSEMPHTSLCRGVVRVVEHVASLMYTTQRTSMADSPCVVITLSGGEAMQPVALADKRLTPSSEIDGRRR